MDWYLFKVNSSEYVAVNWGSIVSSLIILSYVIFLKLSRPAYLDRVSLRIQIAIAFNDIVRHLNYIHGSSLNDDVCIISAFLYFFCFHVNTFLNAAIAFNLQILYLHERIPSQYLGPFLYIFPILLSLTIDLIPLILGAYGRGYNRFCFLKLKYDGREWIKILLLYIANFPLLLYCFAVPAILMFKLLSTRKMPENNQDPELQPLLRTIKNPLSRKLGFRVSLYPLACSLCHLGCMVHNIYVSYEKATYNFIESCAYFGLSINGTLNLICFFFDPYIIESWNPPQIHSNDEDNNSGRVSNQGIEEINANLEQNGTNEATLSSNNTILPTHAISSLEASSSKSNSKDIKKDGKPDSKKIENPPKKVRFNLDLTRYYIAPIPIPGARSPDEYKREIWHTTDLHLDIKKQFRLN